MALGVICTQSEGKQSAAQALATQAASAGLQQLRRDRRNCVFRVFALNPAPSRSFPLVPATIFPQGNQRQVADQKIERSNAALVNNISMRIPVRLIRGCTDVEAVYGKVFVYDGLYDVLSYKTEVGKSGHSVVKFQLRRQPGQPPLTSTEVEFGQGSIPKKFTAMRRPGLVDEDLSGGLERLPVVAVNDVDEELPPCTRPRKVLVRARVRSGAASTSLPLLSPPLPSAAFHASPPLFFSAGSHSVRFFSSPLFSRAVASPRRLR